jgi:hypothetical protein
VFNVEFYEDRNGKSPVSDYIDELDATAMTDKSSRIRLGKILGKERIRNGRKELE